MICVSCGQAITTGDYRLIGIERVTWASQYAHQGNCEAEARERMGAQPMAAPKVVRISPTSSDAEMEVEELSLDEPESISNDTLPRPGLERR